MSRDAFDLRLKEELHGLVDDAYPSPLLRQRVEEALARPQRRGPARLLLLTTVAAAVLALLGVATFARTGHQDQRVATKPGPLRPSPATTAPSASQPATSLEGATRPTASITTLRPTTTSRALMTTPGSPTVQRRFQAFGADGQPSSNLHLTLASGSCFVGFSVADQARADAWRCGGDNALYDPCFAPSAQADYVICVDRPWSTSAVKLQLTQPLPAHDAVNTSANPWVIVLAGGDQCWTTTGTRGAVGGLSETYNCNQNDAYGEVNRSSATWTVQVAPHGQTALHPASITTAWQ